MATKELIKEIITVQATGQWGPKANGVYYGLNDPLKGTDFVVGLTYEVLLSVGKPTEKYPQGKKYISQIVGEGNTSAPPARVVVKNNTPITVNELSNPGTIQTVDKEAYWDKKNDSQKLGGIMHDAAQVTAALITVNGFDEKVALEVYSRVLTGMIDIRKQFDA